MRIINMYFDVETTGLNPYKDEIHQFSAIVENEDGEIIDEIDIKAKPSDIELFKDGVLNLLGITAEEVMARPLDQVGLYNAILAFFDKHVDKYDRNDKFTPIAYNIDFDKGFLRQLFLKNGNRYIDSYLQHNHIDVLAFCHILVQYGGIMKNQSNMKLTTMCELLDIPIEKAHDSLHDTHAMRLLLKWFEEHITLEIPPHLQ